MADKKISQLTAASTPLAGTEVLPIVQSGSTVKVSSDDLTVKNVRSNATSGILQVAGPGAGTTRVMTTPNANFTAARTDAGQTFTGNQIVNGTLDVVSGTGDVFLVNAKTNDSTAANNAGVGFRANSSATAGSRFSQVWFDADGANLSGGDYFLISKNGNSGSADLINYSNSTMRFATDYLNRAAIDLTISATGNITANTGNVVIGTAAKGIDFSANTHAAGMTSELLDWYEEGLFVPTMTASSSGTVTLAYTTLAYTRVGRLVTVTGEITVNSVASPVGDISIGNLPFANSGLSQRASRTAFLVEAGSFTGAPTGVVQGFINANSSTVDIRLVDDFAVTSLASYLQTNTFFRFGFSYMTA